MSDVVLSVGGRSYTVACADGQENHVQRLAGLVDAKLRGMGGNVSSMEAKNLLFAALLLADEVDEARNASRPAAAAPVSSAAGPDTTQLATRLERIATALENAAQVLEGRDANA